MTLRHVVAWKLAEPDAAARADEARTIAERLLALRGVVPAILDITAGADTLGGGNWDVALTVDVADAAALEEYKTHPEHVKVVDYARPRIAERAAVDFEF